MKRLAFIIFLIILVILLFGGYFWFYQVRYFTGRASVKSSIFSVDNSYVFVTPLQAKANGKEKIRIVVFLLDDRGLGVAGQRVELGFYEGLNVEIIQGVTDERGKAVFDVTSLKPGDYYIEIKAGGRKLKQKAHIKFI